MDYCSDRNYGCRIKEFSFRGLKMLELENEVLKVSIILDKGADIYEITYKKLDLDFLWKKPNGIRETKNHILSNPATLGNFEDYYAGGWQDVFAGGGPTNYKGADLGLHGESALIPWQYKVLVDKEEEVSIELTCSLNRIPLSSTKTITLKSNNSSIFFNEIMKNECSEDIEFIWGQHPVYSDLFVNDDCYVETNAKNVIASGAGTYPNSDYKEDEKSSWPNMETKDGENTNLSKMSAGKSGSAELFFLGGFEEEEAWYALRNPRKNLSIGMVFDSKVYKHLWMWRVFNGSPGYPLYGRSYHLALEPFSSYPNNLDEAIKNKTALSIKGNSLIETNYTFVVFEGSDKVKRIDKTGNILAK